MEIKEILDQLGMVIYVVMLIIATLGGITAAAIVTDKVLKLFRRR